MQYVESIDDTERLKFHEDGSATIIRMSPRTKKFNKATMRLTEDQYYRWARDRTLIQDAMSHLDKEEREFILTGYTPADWEAIFPPEEDDKDV